MQTKAALDSATKSTYTVTVTATDTGRLERHHHGDHHGYWFNPGSRWVTDYNTNNNDSIDRDEVIAAIRDYFDDLISRDDVITIIRLYFTT